MKLKFNFNNKVQKIKNPEIFPLNPKPLTFTHEMHVNMYKESKRDLSKVNKQNIWRFFITRPKKKKKKSFREEKLILGWGGERKQE